MVRSARSDRFILEAPGAGERSALDALILRSKAHWGYDAAMMAIMARWLAIDAGAIAQDRVRAARCGTALAGVVQIGPLDGQACELDALFIDPAFIGTGVGRLLYDWALDTARAGGALTMTILSDPFARGFYEAMGARFIADVPSRAVPGRTLPRLVHDLDGGNIAVR